VPTVQSLLLTGARDLPFGLGDQRDLVYWLTIALGLAILFVALCITYAAVPKGAIPWACVWPGALAATLAAGVLDFAFPIYLSTTSTLRIGTSAVFVLIALVWFYVLALIVLGGAVINELRFERVRPAGSAASPEPRAATPPRVAAAPMPAARASAGRADDVTSEREES
jgi:membrane protein